jgi:nucleotide-binding universal stress UspA family protein
MEKTMSIEKILFPTKFREHAFNALETLLPLKDAGLKEVVFCHVISRKEVGFVPFGGYLKDEEEKRREEARIRFEDWQKSLSKNGISSKIIIEVGEIVHEILKTAEEEKIDLVVVGRKKRIDTSESFIGSYTHKIITRSKLPVMVSKYMVQFTWEDATLTKINDKPFEMPLFCCDWSDRSRRASELLTSIRGVVKKIYVFHNITVKMDKDHDKADLQSREQESMEKLKRYCEIFREAGIEAEPHLGAGAILDELLRVSRERKATMVVIGNTCVDRFFHNMLHKSLSYQVAKMSELPTLLVP